MEIAKPNKGGRIEDMTPDDFWKFYNETLLPMTPEAKMQYMLSV